MRNTYKKWQGWDVLVKLLLSVEASILNVTSTLIKLMNKYQTINLFFVRHDICALLAIEHKSKSDVQMIVDA